MPPKPKDKGQLLRPSKQIHSLLNLLANYLIGMDFAFISHGSHLAAAVASR
jgi:hypothetical protein